MGEIRRELLLPMDPALVSAAALTRTDEELEAVMAEQPYTLTAGYMKPRRRLVTKDPVLRFWPGWMLRCARKCRPFPGGLPDGYCGVLGNYTRRWWRFYQRVDIDAAHSE